jgi:hypothetical protein
MPLKRLAAATEKGCVTGESQKEGLPRPQAVSFGQWANNGYFSTPEL